MSDVTSDTLFLLMWFGGLVRIFGGFDWDLGCPSFVAPQSAFWGSPLDGPSFGLYLYYM